MQTRVAILIGCVQVFLPLRGGAFREQADKVLDDFFIFGCFVISQSLLACVYTHILGGTGRCSSLVPSIETQKNYKSANNGRGNEKEGGGDENEEGK